MNKVVLIVQRKFMFSEITAIPLHWLFIMQTRQEYFLVIKLGVSNLAFLALKKEEEAASLSQIISLHSGMLHLVLVST